MVSRSDFEKFHKKIKNRMNQNSLEKRMSQAVKSHIDSTDVFKKKATPKKAFRDTKIAKIFSNNPVKKVRDYLREVEMPRFEINKPQLSQKAKKALFRFAVAVSPFIMVGAVNTVSNGSNLNKAETVNVVDTKSKTDKEPIKVLSAEEIREIQMKEIADVMLADGANIIQNFDLEGRVFSAEELDMLNQSELGQKLVASAQKTSKRSRPAPGEQTMCLGGVKSILSRTGIKLDAHKFAYRAAEGLRKNEHFVEIECEMKDIPHLVDGAVIVWGKGTTKYGHVAMKVGQKEYCDYVYGLRTRTYRSPGQNYSKADTFVDSQTALHYDLVLKLCQEGRLKKEVENDVLAKINNTKQEKNPYLNDQSYFAGQFLNNSAYPLNPQDFNQKQNESETANLISQQRSSDSQSEAKTNPARLDRSSENNQQVDNQRKTNLILRNRDLKNSSRS